MSMFIFRVGFFFRRRAPLHLLLFGTLLIFCAGQKKSPSTPSTRNSVRNDGSLQKLSPPVEVPPVKPESTPTEAVKTVSKEADVKPKKEQEPKQKSKKDPSVKKSVKDSKKEKSKEKSNEKGDAAKEEKQEQEKEEEKEDVILVRKKEELEAEPKTDLESHKEEKKKKVVGGSKKSKEGRLKLKGEKAEPSGYAY
ncbi:unnamed protein product [Caenorhabditis sp. 36 PRJEB53466]|nr:unnamed protein product [Caenorhabditis sp. 36 PRJEB53466]